jgi:hypothetical protein
MRWSAEPPFSPCASASAGSGTYGCMHAYIAFCVSKGVVMERCAMFATTLLSASSGSKMREKRMVLVGQV